MLKHADTYVAIAAHFHSDASSGKIVLTPVDVVPVTGKSMELSWASEGPPPQKGKPPVAASGAPAPAKKLVRTRVVEALLGIVVVWRAGVGTRGTFRHRSREALARGDDGALSRDERTFLYVPFMHSEEVTDQERGVALFLANREAQSLRAAATSLGASDAFPTETHSLAALRRPRSSRS